MVKSDILDDPEYALTYSGSSQNGKNKKRGVRGKETSKGAGCCNEDALGTIFGSLIIGVSRNPSLKDELSKIAAFGAGLVVNERWRHRRRIWLCQSHVQGRFQGGSLTHDA